MSAALDSLQQIADKIDAAIATFQITVQAVTEKINAVDPKDPTALEQIAAIQAEYKAARDTYVGIVKPAFDEMQTIINGLPADEKNAGQKIFNDVSTRNNISTEKAAAYTATRDTKKAEAQAAVDDKNKEVEDNAAKTPEQTDQQNKQYTAEGGAQDDKGGPTEANSNTPTSSTASGDATTLPTVTVTGKKLPGKDPSKSGPRLRKNPLGNFSSYTYQITLYMITPDAYNAFVLSGKKDINAFQNALDAVNQRDAANVTTSNSSPTASPGSPPASSSKKLLGGGVYVVAQSGGVGPGQKRAPTMDNDLYIDDLKITQAINAKATLTNTNNTSLSFSITEPYGFSFLTQLQTAAEQLATVCKTAGYKDLQNPSKQFFILGVQFLGYDADGKLINSKDIPGAEGDPTANSFGLYQRYYDIYITKLSWKIDGRNVVYAVQAANIPNSPFKTKRGVVPHSLAVIGKTVYDALMGGTTLKPDSNQNQAKTNRLANKSVPPNSGNTLGLITALNAFEESLVRSNTIDLANQWDIKFIGDAESYIKNSDMVTPNDLNKLRWGRDPNVTDTGKSNDANSTKPGVPNPDSRIVQVQGGTMILQAINTIITQSTFMTDGMTLLNMETEELNLKPNEQAKTMVWYNVSAQVEILGWDTKVGDFAYKTTYIFEIYDTPMVLSTYIKNTSPYYGPHKRYQYWYTGQNSEIIKYEQTMDNTYFVTTLNPNGTPASQGGGADVATKAQPSGAIKQGGENQSIEPQNNYIRNLIDPVAAASAKITILGDPDYLMETSTSSSATVYSKFNGKDGFTINPNGGQVFIEIDFDEPNDYNMKTGLMNINEKIRFWKYPDSVKDKIQGLAFMLTEVSSRFSKGKFEQDLTGVMAQFDSAKATANPTSSNESRAETDRLAGKNATLAAGAGPNESQAETNRLNRSSNASVPTIPDGTAVSPLTPITSLSPTSFLDPAQRAQLSSLNSVGSINNVMDPMQRMEQNQNITILTKSGPVADGESGP